MISSIAVNWRLSQEPVTGVTRYAREIISRFPSAVPKLRPKRRLTGVRGHLWEQAVLPLLLGKRILWNPNCTGPVSAQRFVVTVHDLAAIEHPEWFGRRFSRWYAYLLPALARRAAAVVCVSRFTRDRLLALTGVNPAKVTVVPNGIGGEFRPLPDSEIASRLQLLRLPSPNYVLTVGSVEPRKNLTTILSAWERVQREIDPSIWLLVAGGVGPGRVFRNGLPAISCPRVHFLGHVDDVTLPALYASAKAFVYAPLYEGFGLPPLEALACGTPVIASAITPLIETLGDGIAALADPLDVSGLKSALVGVINDSAGKEKMRALGIRHAQKFSWDEAARQTWAVLTAVAQG